MVCSLQELEGGWLSPGRRNQFGSHRTAGTTKIVCLRFISLSIFQWARSSKKYLKNSNYHQSEGIAAQPSSIGVSQVVGIDDSLENDYQRFEEGFCWFELLNKLRTAYSSVPSELKRDINLEVGKHLAHGEFDNGHGCPFYELDLWYLLFVLDKRQITKI